MKVFQISQSDISGGAARAAYRIHHALRDLDLNSKMIVERATAGDWTVTAPQKIWPRTKSMASRLLSDQFTRLVGPESVAMHSPAMVPSNKSKQLNNSDADLIHLHWLNGEMFSIADIGRIRKPVLWTLHDMWAFCGAEHYSQDLRWQSGYTAANRPGSEAGFDLNRWTWSRKQKHWQTPMQIVTPSHWLANIARESALMKHWPVAVIPNPIDTDIWKPMDKSIARALLNLPADIPILLFGSIGGTLDPRKGFDLLLDAMQHLRSQIAGLELLLFGQLTPENPPALGFPLHYTGHLHDDLSLRALYCAADALVIPSRQDNLPNTGVESLACGTPVIAFDSGGLGDIVEHKSTGYLASAFDTVDLASGISWVLENNGDDTLSLNARQKAIKEFDNRVITRKYLEIYEKVLAI
ncbi:MAG: glycosyltransferase family 4 protein [Pseudomonadales bacterium]|nr:glycosyltransferase family 4 protein [Pseudomonadales bacterium]